MAEENLKTQVYNWLRKEGYPLEYYASSCFRSAGLFVRQGSYSRPGGQTKPREIDLVVEANYADKERLLRIATIVECKWSGDKPLVIFTSKQAHIHESACICHAISSDVCDAALWLLRDDIRIKSLKTFSTPEEPGIGGRQAFGTTDKFFNAMISVVAACTAATREIDSKSKIDRRHFNFGLIAFPLIVVEGKIFEAVYNEDTHAIDPIEVSHSRCHWHGSPDWPLRVDIDIVSRSYLQEFAHIRRNDCDIIGHLAHQTLNDLHRAFIENDDAILRKTKGPTGRSAPPRLLYELSRQIAERKTNKI